MSKPFAWSFSALESFETCPRRHYLTRVAKLVDEPTSDEMHWGKQVHKAFENFMKSGTPFSHTMAQFEAVGKFFKKIADTSDEILTEQQWAIDEEWMPTDWFAKNTWCRAVIDLALLRNRAAALVDWKTGKMKEGYDQLKLTALMNFARHSSDQHKITYVIGTVNKNQNPGGKITERVLQCEADNKTDDTQASQYRPQRDTNL